MKEHVRAIAGNAVLRMSHRGFDVVCGSAGTVMSLAGITARRLGDAPATLRNYCVKIEDLRETVAILCRLSLPERRNVPGLDADRADIILGGAAILMSLLTEVKAQSLLVSDRGLRDGILQDILMREDQARATFDSMPVRLRSVLKLCRACGFDEPHALHVQRLGLSFFDDLSRLGIHPYGDRERELLGYGLLSHDIGSFLSHSGHEKHAYYLVRHSELLGFDDLEIAIIANIALYHPNMASLPTAARKLVRTLAAIVRVAEGLDRSHLGLVESAQLRVESKPRRASLSLECKSECDLEIWGVQQSRSLFEAVFGLPLSITLNHGDQCEHDGNGQSPAVMNLAMEAKNA